MSEAICTQGRFTVLVLTGFAGWMLCAFGFGESSSALIMVAVKQACLFFGNLLLILSLCGFYTLASGGFVKAKLKILDWCFIGFILLMIQPFILLDMPPISWFWIVVLPSVGARLLITWYLRRPWHERLKECGKKDL